MTRARARARAFTLVEAVVVMAALSLLVTLGYPSYRGHIYKVRRTEAKQSLIEVAHRLERCYTRYRRYDDPDCPLVGADPTVSVLSPNGYYRIASRSPEGIESLPLVPADKEHRPPAESFVLYATPEGKQTGDNQCAAFVLTSGDARSARDAAGGAAAGLCW